MNKEITSVTILGEESHKEMVFIPATKKKVEIPKKSLTKEDIEKARSFKTEKYAYLDFNF